MSKLALFASLLSAAVGLAVGHWSATHDLFTASRPTATRSVTTVPDDFAPPGLTGEVRDTLLIPDLLERTAALSSLLRGLGPEALPQVRDAYASVLLDLGDVEFVLLGDWWARFDPPGAMLWTNQNWQTRESTPVLQGIMRQWGRSDPMAAMVAASAAQNNQIRRRWIDSALRGWDESVHDGALEFAESLASGPDQQWALYVVTRRRVLRDGPEAALAWAESLPDDEPNFKLNAFRRVAGAAAEVDPLRAAEFAERHLDGPYSSGLPERVGTHWVLRDGDAAMRWLGGLGAGSNRDDGVRESFRLWMITDQSAAEQWIVGVEPAPWLDPAIALYAKRLGVKNQPEVALEWAGRIENPELRNPTIGSIARYWLVRDAAAANAWLEGSGLPPEYIARIRVLPAGFANSLER